MTVPEGPPDDDVEAARVRAAVKQRLFGGPVEHVTIGRFEISARLGEGAMGVVYEARDPKLDRQVALKLLHPDVRADATETRTELLLEEARAMARVRHPNVVTVHEVGTHADQVYVAMERLKETLGAWIARVQPSTERRLQVLIAAGRGLAAVHRQGLVHRDFKLDNVLMDDDGQPRVSDFGLVQRSGATRNAQAGTPAYMSPEQLRGEPADERSDQFSYCVTALEVLSGKRPFEATSVQALSQTQLQPLPERALSGVPASVVPVLRRGLSPEPSERFPSMDALLERLAISREQTRASWRWLAAAVVGAAAVIAAVVLLIARAPETEAQTPAPSASLAPSATPSAEASIRDITRLCRTGVRASSEKAAHPAAHAFDGSSSTAWTEDARGDGAGSWLEASLREGTWVSAVEVGGGWSSSTASGLDLWKHNGTFRKMRVSWDGGEQIVEFDRDHDRGKRKRVEIGASTRSIRITALEVDRGRFADLCLDEVAIFGRCYLP